MASKTLARHGEGRYHKIEALNLVPRGRVLKARTKDLTLTRSQTLRSKEALRDFCETVGLALTVLYDAVRSEHKS